MANLFWRSPKGTKALLATPFKTEEELERIVFSDSELLEEIVLLKRQVRGGAKSGIPDIIGMDSDGNVCILEIKNVRVDAGIIPQVLEYAFWAEGNPDSIKSLWLEAADKPDDITPNWDNLQVRILIIAPEIHKSTLDLVGKINYQVDLIEVRRWIDEKNEFLHINKLEAETTKSRVRPTTGRPEYNEKFYKTIFNPRSVDEFLKYVREVEGLIKRNDWELETNFKKLYCGFKAGAFNAFGIKWIGSKTFAFYFKLPEAEAKRFRIPMTRYENEWKEAVYYIHPGKTSARPFEPLFRAAYKRLTGD